MPPTRLTRWRIPRTSGIGEPKRFDLIARRASSCNTRIWPVSIRDFFFPRISTRSPRWWELDRSGHSLRREGGGRLRADPASWFVSARAGSFPPGTIRGKRTFSPETTLGQGLGNVRFPNPLGHPRRPPGRTNPGHGQSGGPLRRAGSSERGTQKATPDHPLNGYKISMTEIVKSQSPGCFGRVTNGTRTSLGIQALRGGRTAKR